MLAMLFQIFFFRSVSLLSVVMSLPVWGATKSLFQALGLTCCSPAAVRMAFFKERVGCSKSSHALGKGRLEYSPLDWLCCLLPQAAPSRGCSLCAIYGSCQPCLCPTTSPRGAEPFSTGCCSGFLQANPSLSHHWQNSSLSSLIALVLQLLPLFLLCFSITHEAPSPSPGLAPEPAVPLPCPLCLHCCPLRTVLHPQERARLGPQCQALCFLYWTPDMFSAWCKAYSTNGKSCFDFNGFQMKALD